MKKPVLYPKNKAAALDPSLFENPTAEYRGAPFWSWNAKIDLPQLFRQIDQFKAMGFGGFNIHSRTGLATEYLGPEWMAAVKACTERGAELGMLSWLYDEDRWPSGSAGGIVTRDHTHRIKHLLWTTTPYHDPKPPAKLADYTAAERTENGQLIARYEVELEAGYLRRYKRLKDSDKRSASARIWYAYVETPFESPWFNFQTYADTFSPAAMQRFIETTHERYHQSVGNHFGGSIPAIFTDEPQFIKKSHFLRADETRDLFMPWTTDFPETFQKAYKQNLLDHLPELFWNLPEGKPSVARYRYHDHTAERFACGFADTIGDWCDQHGLALTGHLLGEGQLFSQTRGIGEAMRPLRAFHIPGIDILCDKPEYVTAKQAQSIVHQFGREAMLSEMYGVTNWDFDFIGHKAQGDWQAALGVTVRVPHLAWVSMAGESKRDYPAAIGYQSPWYKEYPLIENHFARVATVLSRGKPLVRVAVIHPIESYWLAWGPIEHVQPEWEQREAAIRDITAWLLTGLIDFDFVSEALLPQQSPSQAGKQFSVGKMKYDAVIVPGMRTIRSTTLKRLEHFAKAGGRVIFAGEVPTLVDAVASAAPSKLAKKCETIPWDRQSLLKSVSPFREIDIRHADGAPADSMLHQLRTDGRRRHLFICNTDRDRPRHRATIRLRGKWDAIYLDTATGAQHAMPTTVSRSETTIGHDFSAHGHLLLTLSPARTTAHPKAGHEEPSHNRPSVVEKPTYTEIARLDDPVPITLAEPNVLLLDQAIWRIDGGPWNALEEILRLETKARAQLQLPPRGGRIAQPWTDTTPAPVVAQVQLKFIIRSKACVAAPLLAIEEPQSLKIHFDGRPISTETAGWWVDESIKQVRLPSFSPGDHELLLTVPFTRKTNLEWCYLLGDFGVEVAGQHAKIVAPVRSLAFGDWTRQGLPFYAGNVTYHCKLHGSGQPMLIEIAKFKSPLLSIDLDGKPAGKIAFAPFQLALGSIAGDHKLDITAYGNRVNAFGALHNADEKLTWFGPPAWRSSGVNWSYEYQLRPMGVITAPIVKATNSP